MSGSKYLYISESADIYEIPHPKDGEYKPIIKLADKDVLTVCICYETMKRKPFRLTIINFDRVKLDNNGGYSLSQEIIDKKMRNFLEYGFTTPEDLSEREDPWAIPDALTIPNSSEIDTLKKHLKQKYPLLYKNCSQIIAEHIQDCKAIHRKNIDLIKKAINLRNKRSTSQTK